MLDWLVDDTRRRSAHTGRMTPDEECDEKRLDEERKSGGQKANERDGGDCCLWLWLRQRRLGSRGRGDDCMAKKHNVRMRSHVARGGEATTTAAKAAGG